MEPQKMLKGQRLVNAIKAFPNTKIIVWIWKPISIVLEILATLNSDINFEVETRNLIKKERKINKIITTHHKEQRKRLIQKVKPVNNLFQLEKNDENSNINKFVTNLNKKRIYLMVSENKAAIDTQFEEAISRLILIEPGSLLNTDPSVMERRDYLMRFDLKTFNAKKKKNIPKREKQMQKFYGKEQVLEFFWEQVALDMEDGEYLEEDLGIKQLILPEKFDALDILDTDEDIDNDIDDNTNNKNNNKYDDSDTSLRSNKYSKYIDYLQNIGVIEDIEGIDEGKPDQAQDEGPENIEPLNEEQEEKYREEDREEDMEGGDQDFPFLDFPVLDLELLKKDYGGLPIEFLAMWCEDDEEFLNLLGKYESLTLTERLLVNNEEKEAVLEGVNIIYDYIGVELETVENFTKINWEKKYRLETEIKIELDDIIDEVDDEEISLYQYYFADLRQYARKTELPELKAICPVFFSKKQAEVIFETIVEQGLNTAQNDLMYAPLGRRLQFDNVQNIKIIEMGLGDFVQFYSLAQGRLTKDVYKQLEFLFLDPSSKEKLGFRHYRDSLNKLRQTINTVEVGKAY